MHSMTRKLFSLLLLLPMIFPASAQELIDISRLVFDVRLQSDTDLEITPPLDPSSVDNEEYRTLAQSAASYQQAINDIQQQSASPYDFELLEQYQDLGDVYFEMGRFEDAITNYDNAIQITKIQGGLDNMDQLVLAEKIAQSYLAMYDLDNANIWKEYIHYVNQRNFEPGTREMVEATSALADWYISYFFKENLQSVEYGLRMTMEMVPRQGRSLLQNVQDEARWSEQSGGLSNISTRSPTDMVNPQFLAIINGEIRDLRPQDVEDTRLLRVNRLYQDLQQDIYAREEPDLDSIVQIARKIANLAFITKQEMDYERSNYTFNSAYNNSREEEFRNSQERLDHSFESGEEALRFVVNVLLQTEYSTSFTATSMIELADWYLAYGRMQAAQNTYQEANDLLIESGFSQEQIDESLQREIPRQVPTIATHLYTRESAGYAYDAELDYRGFIDVSFTLDRQGNPRDVSFASNDRPESPQIQQILSDMLKNAKYRPNLVGGELVSPGQVNLRYFYSY